jgi:hypothetical protein
MLQFKAPSFVITNPILGYFLSPYQRLIRLIAATDTADNTIYMVWRAEHSQFKSNPNGNYFKGRT